MSVIWWIVLGLILLRLALTIRGARRRRGLRVGRLPHFGRRPNVQPGSLCRCGGTVVPRVGQFGPFLGCTRHRSDDTGCNNVWQINGRRF